MDKKIITFDDTEIEKYKFYQCKSLISIDNTDFNKIVVSNQTSFGKTGFKYLIGYQDANILGLYVYSLQKRMHIEEILIKVNVCLF